jgi:hypothetical protein
MNNGAGWAFSDQDPGDELTRQRLRYRAPKGRAGIPVGRLPSVRVRIFPEHQGPLAERMQREAKSVPEVVDEALELLFRLPPEVQEQLLLEASASLEQPAAMTAKELVS